MTIALSGGGTAGHIVPLLTLAQELKRQSPDCRLVYIGFRDEKMSHDLGVFDAVYRIRAGKLRRWPMNLATILLNFRDVFLVAAGFLQALAIFRHERPDVFFSKGSFVAVPSVLAAHLKNIPIVTHDSDAVAGLANRLAKNWAVWHATGFPTKLYGYPSKSARYTGVPLEATVFKTPEMAALQKIKLKLGLNAGSRILLVMSGSLGAASLNQKIPLVSKTLLAEDKDLVVVHVSGSRYLESVKEAYDPKLISERRVQLHSYTESLNDYMRVASLVISRAGATTLAELAALAKPALVVASPHLAGGHQLKNAEWYKSHSAIETIDDSASIHELTAAVKTLLDDSNRLQKLSAAISKLAKPSAAAELAKLILNSAKAGDF